MKSVELTRGQTALVDDDDYDRVIAYRWCYHPAGYAARRERRAERPLGGHRGLVYLHRFILGLDRSDKRVVDHINRNPLDCRRENLRAVSQAENGFARIQVLEARKADTEEIYTYAVY